MSDARPTAADLPGEGYRLAVAVGNPENVEQLVRTAADIARDRDGELLVLSAVVKPDVSPVKVFEDDVIKRRFSGDRAELLDRATEIAAETDSDLPVGGQLLVARGVSEAIVGGVSEFDCDGLLLGWHDRQRRDAILGSNVDRILERAPCDVFVERITTPIEHVDSILLPVAASPHTDLAASVARAIARTNDATVDVIHVLDPGSTGDERQAGEDLLDATAAGLGSVTHETRLVEARSVANAIVDEAAEHDVIVLGSTRSGDLQRRLVGSVPQEVSRRTGSITILTRQGGAHSRVRTWVRKLVPFA